MNESGDAVAKAKARLGMPNANLLVVHDDLERKLGALSVKRGGSANGHNGIRSLIHSLHSTHFARFRAGIGKPEDKALVADYVLQPFSRAELQLIHDELESRFFGSLLQTIQEEIEKTQP